MVLFWQTDISSVAETFSRVNLSVISILIFLQAITQLLISYQWKRLAVLNDSTVTMKQMLQMNMMGSFVESITPSVKIGGEAIKVWWLKTKLCWSGTKSASLLILQKSISGTMFLVAALLFIVPYFAIQQQGLTMQRSIGTANSHWTAIFLLVAVFALLTVWIFLSRDTPERPMKILTLKLTDIKSSIVEHWSNINGKKNEKMIQLSISTVIWLLYPLKMYILSRSAGMEITLLTAGAVVFTAYIAAMIPALPGGIGTFEGAMVLMLALADVTASQALALAIMFRTITFWLVCVASGIATAYFYFSRTKTSSAQDLLT